MRRVLALAGLAAAAVVGVSLAQGRSEATPLRGLPQWTAGYTSWTKLNRRPIPPRASDAHSGTKNVYASKPARNGVYPVGTVIVKDIRRPGSRTIDVVAAMRKRSRGANRGWEMIEWTRSSPSARFTILAQGQICYSCHVGAKPDYVFTKKR